MSNENKGDTPDFTRQEIADMDAANNRYSAANRQGYRARWTDQPFDPSKPADWQAGWNECDKIKGTK